ncbi:MAG TPA: adenine-specific DNA methylase [Verrucomicrobiae bacterium]|nr:adenine-specific DNA methylase [Verrucomicrobiae bacterium]
MDESISLQRVCYTANSETFQIRPIGDLVKQYIQISNCSVDCFSRNNKWAHITNDLNTNTAADYHLDVRDFLLHLERDSKTPDLVIFDPPYSPRQIKECYQGIGLSLSQKDTQRVGRWTEEKKIIERITAPGAVFIQCGWSSYGISGWPIERLILVNHGAGHYDTICLVQRKPAQRLQF